MIIDNTEFLKTLIDGKLLTLIEVMDEMQAWCGRYKVYFQQMSGPRKTFDEMRESIQSCDDKHFFKMPIWDWCSCNIEFVINNNIFTYFKMIFEKEEEEENKREED